MPTPTISQSIAITGVSDLVPVPSGFSKSSSDDFVFAETDFSGFFSLADLPLIPHSLHYFFLDSTGLRRIIPFMLFQLEPFFPIFVVFSFFVSFSFLLSSFWNGIVILSVFFSPVCIYKMVDNENRRCLEGWEV